MNADTDTSRQDDAPATDDPPADDSPASEATDERFGAGRAATAEELSELVEGVLESAPPEDPRERIKQLEAEKVRIAADFANYQKRVNRDRATWSREAVRDLVASMLTVLDNLELSITAFEGEVKDPAVYRQGVELVQTELLRVLGNNDLARIEASEGTPFDPDLHQAISVMPVEGLEQEEVAMVARSGYRLGDVVLRPAQVVVRKPA